MARGARDDVGVTATAGAGATAGTFAKASRRARHKRRDVDIDLRSFALWIVPKYMVAPVPQRVRTEG